ncbi:Cytochrome P450 [Nannocystis exedens]|uniref:Cytochrome P450 n=1 Tax=Nannocystis exedens TaxID=54 RepID=A0A1I2A4I9_9BACT|nr:cytochrome P450 [Nannocystis exedens]PCC69631.1 cytochrome P450 [Nannocystis exedens]SFE38717.1 Cytochrome P450 [Nannocystis exedens]
MLDIPLPRRLQGPGNMLHLAFRPEQFIARQTAVAPIHQVVMPWFSPYLVSDPELIDEVLVGRSKLFIKDRFTRELSLVTGNGLLVSDGDFWRRQRRLAQPAFHRERIAAYGAVMVEHAERLASTWREGQVLDIHAAMMRLTLDIVADTLFSTGVDRAIADTIGGALDVIMERFSDYTYAFLPWLARVPLPKNRRFHEARGRIDGAIRGIIAARRASGRDEGDLLSMLLRARDDEGGQMTDEQLRDEAFILFVAGHETTALALSWTWMLLSQHPAAWDKLRAELDHVLGDRAPTLADVPALRYTDWVAHESMRLYPPAWSIGREALEDLELGGVAVPRGAQLWMFQWAAHRDPRYFPRPDSFEPERWDADLARRIPRFAYFPFGGGPRLCIGNNFAMLELVLVLATLARRWRPFVRAADRPRPQFSITLRPAGGMRATLQRR